LKEESIEKDEEKDKNPWKTGAMRPFHASSAFDSVESDSKLMVAERPKSMAEACKSAPNFA